jgi:hypothetical protein
VPYRGNLFDALVDSTTALAAAVLLAARTRYRAVADAPLGGRLSVWCRKTWDNSTSFAVIVLVWVLLQFALMVFAFLL